MKIQLSSASEWLFFWHWWWLLETKFPVFLVFRFLSFFTMHHLLLAWTLPFAEICWTVDHRPLISRLPASQPAQAAHFPGASTGLDSEVGLNGPRNCPFGEPSSNIGQLPPGKMGRLSSDHSFCSKCCHMASKRGLKGPSNKTAWWLGASLSMCLVTLKKGTTRAFFAANIYHEQNLCPKLGFCSERPCGD